jgi:hypothetical protein
MAFTDPISLTINAGAVSFPRVGSGPYQGQWQTADGLRKVEVSHALRKRNRSLIRLNSDKYVADVLVPTQNVRASMSVSLVIDVPSFGYTSAEAVLEARGLVDFLQATSGAKLTQLMGHEA